MHIEIYDTTLRDGAQGEGVSFSLEDKVLIARRLDSLGFDFIEGGFPLSNPKDAEFFQRIAAEPLKNSKLCAFGMTRRRGMKAGDDPGIKALLDAQTPVVTIVGKTSDFHATEVLGVSLEENLAMIRDTVAFFRENGREVVYDAEHFFDGWKANPEYAAKTIQAAAEAGAMRIVMCDTNGGSLPEEIAALTKEAAAVVDVPLGIHCHNDCELAVANSLAAVDAGATHVQGTINGFGERCGNVDLISVIANLALKKNPGGDTQLTQKYDVLTKTSRKSRSIRYLTELSRYVYEIANMNLKNGQPFVGPSAFAHKGGMHVHAVTKSAKTYEHIDPVLVGNERRVLISELSGRSNIVARAKKLRLRHDSDLMNDVLREVVQLEKEGYHFEAAEASFDLRLMRKLGAFKAHFELMEYWVSVQSSTPAPTTKAVVKVRIWPNLANEFERIPDVDSVAEGDGPVNALDTAIRKALTVAFPKLRRMQLVDYKVRVINSEAGSAAKVSVMIESRDTRSQYRRVWTTIGVHENVIEASKIALIDSFEYMLIKDYDTSGKSPEILAQKDAFMRWRARQTHDFGTLKGPDKAKVAAINSALEALLVRPEIVIDTNVILDWISKNLSFGESILSKKRIEEHCMYEAGAQGTKTKSFGRPKQNPVLRVVRDGEYALAQGLSAFVFQSKSHRNK